MQDLFPDAGHVRLLGLDRTDDLAIWRYAKANDFVIVTLDSDFSEFATLFGAPPKIVWLRCGSQPSAAVEALLRAHAPAIAAFASGDAGCLEIY